MGTGELVLEHKANSDSYITSKPQITFFKKNINRHTHFCRQWNDCIFNTTCNWDTTLSCSIDKYGDLLGHIYLILELNTEPIVLENADCIQLYYDDIRQWKNRHNDLEHTLTEYINLSIGKFDEVVEKYKLFIDKLELNTLFTTIRSAKVDIKSDDDIGNMYNTDTNMLLDNAFDQRDETIVLSRRELDEIIDNIIPNNGDDTESYYEIYKFMILDDYKNICEQLFTLTNDKISDYSKYIQDTKNLNNQPPIGPPHNYLTIRRNIESLRKQEQEHVIHRISQKTLDIQYRPDLFKYILNNVSISIADTKIDSKNIHQLRKSFEFRDQTYSDSFMKMCNIQKGTNSTTQQILIPLHFWFSEVTTQFLPIVALRYEDITIDVEINKFENIVMHNEEELSILSKYENENDIAIVDGKLLCEYLYLSSEERNRFTTRKLEYIVTSSNYMEQRMMDVDYEMSFNFALSTKELYWFVFDSNSGNYLKIDESKLYFTSEYGTDIIDPMYYSTVLPVMNHSASNEGEIFNVFDFSLFPKHAQPSGSCNLGVIPHKQLHVSINKSLKSLVNNNVVYLAVGSTVYNILTIEHGMSSLQFTQ